MKNIHSPTNPTTNPTTNPILNTTNGTVNGAQKESEWDHEKFEVLKMFFHPIHFKSLNWKNEKKSATNDKLIQK